MTDLEKLLSIIGGKIYYKKLTTEDFIYDEGFSYFEKDVIILKVENSYTGYGDMKYNLGYDMYSTWIFDKDGKFLAVGHWE